MDKTDFKQVIRSLEEQSVVTEEIYDLENVKHVYGGEEYDRLISEIRDENYGEALDLLDEFEEGDDL